MDHRDTLAIRNPALCTALGAVLVVRHISDGGFPPPPVLSSLLASKITPNNMLIQTFYIHTPILLPLPMHTGPDWLATEQS